MVGGGGGRVGADGMPDGGDGPIGAGGLSNPGGDSLTRNGGNPGGGSGNLIQEAAASSMENDAKFSARVIVHASGARTCWSTSSCGPELDFSDRGLE